MSATIHIPAISYGRGPAGEIVAASINPPALQFAEICELGGPLPLGAEVDVEDTRCAVVSRRYDHANPRGPCWVAKVVPLPPPICRL